VVSGTTSQPRLRLNQDVSTLAVDVFLFAMKVALIFFAVWALIGVVALQADGRGLSAVAWRDLLVGGLAQGFMYGLIALGYSMVYGVLGFINFAHGEVFMAGAMGAYFVADALFDAGLWESAFIVAFVICLASSVLISTVIAVVVERTAYRPLRGAPRLIPLITSIGLSFFLQYAIRGLFGEGFKTFPVLPVGLQDRVSVFGIEVEGIKLLVIVTAIISMAALWLFVERSKTGRAIRAVAEDKEIAALMGIDVNRTIVMTFAVGGAMAGVGGMLWAMLFRKVYFLTGFLPGIKAFTAAVLGGIGNLLGAMLGGVTLGIVEAAGPNMLSGLQWELPTWVGWVVAVVGVVSVVWAIRRLRAGDVRGAGTSLGMLILGAVGVFVGIFVLPGASVTIPGASQLKDMIAFIVLIGVLMVRPVGLLGERLAVEDRA
jgi:branched-chain amino acid transport system permease protein